MSLTLTRPPKDDDELYWLVQALWGHCIPRHKVCPDHDAPFDAFKAAYFAREPQVLIHGSRGLAGKSRLLSILGLTEAAVLGADVNLLGGSMAQSTNIHETMRDAWDHKNAPRYLVQGDTTQNLIKLTNGAKIRPLTASQRTVRGPHPPRLLLDEIDEMDEKILEGALGQPMPQKNWLGETIPAQTVFSSTWQYPSGTMTSQMARFREEGLPIFTWCYKDTANPIDGWLDADFIEQKKREIPKEMWRVEYELGEPSIGTRAFDSEAVERTFEAHDEDWWENHRVKVQRDYEEYAFEDYHTSGEYVISADWAKEQDFTVITVWRVDELPMRLCYFLKFRRLPYPVMINRYKTLMTKYHADGIHDATGLGGVIADHLDDRVHNFKMTGEKRDNMLSDYVNAVEKGAVRSPRIDSFYRSHLYASVDDLYARGKEFHLPDDICSSALAWHLVSRRVSLADPVVLANLNDPNWMAKEIQDNKAATKKSTSEWNVGQVVRKDDDDAYSLLV